MLDLRDLELLVAVVDAGSITRGAERCGLSLPAASGRLSSLERRHGVRLLERNRRGVVATVAGRLLVDEARGLLDGADRIEAGLAARAHRVRHTVRLATNSAAADALPEFLAAVLNRLPHLAVELTESNSAAAIEAVREGRADLAIASVLSDDITGCQTLPLWDDPLVVVGTPASIPATPLTLALVVGEPMVGLTPDVPFQRLVDGELRRAGLRATFRVRFPTMAAVCAVASSGVGRAIVPRAVALRNGLGGRSQTPLDEPWAATDRHAVMIATEFARLPPVVREVADLLVRHRDELTG